jgi:hypothetical protein
MTDRDNDDDQQRKSTAGRVERATIPGIPTRHLPPVRLRPAADEHTPPEPWTDRGRAKRTQIGVAPPAPGSAPLPKPEPPRNLSPFPGERVAMPPAPPRPVSAAPDSDVAVDVRTPMGRVSVKKTVLRHLWLWLAPALLSALGFVGGVVRGYFLGLAMAHDEIVKIHATQQLDHDHLTRLDAKEEAAEAEAAAEANSNRAERATALRKLAQFAEDLEKVKAAQPKIQGLARPAP